MALLGALLLVSGGLAAQTFSSGPQQVSLIELYTSEGCSSCPPAEEYLNSLQNHPKLWQRFIPLALHVDYWDYLGWRDKFASPSHTQRQRQYARVNAQRTIYTPGFFVDGRPWRPGLFGSLPDLAQRKVGELKLELNKQHVQAQFHPLDSASRANVLTVAVLGMGYQSQIQAGENGGRSARHDFVVLNHTQVTGQEHRWSLELPKFESNGAKRLALVAWVSDPGSPVPLQAVGGFLH